MIPFPERGNARGRTGLEENVESSWGHVSFEVPVGNLHEAVQLPDILTEIRGRGLDQAFRFGICQCPSSVYSHRVDEKSRRQGGVLRAESCQHPQVSL